MAHIRQQVRDALVTLLSGATAAGTRVEASRVYPTAENRLPAIRIYTLNEANPSKDMGSDGDLMREISVQLDVFAKGQQFDNALDSLAVEIETLIANSAELGSVCSAIFLESTNFDLAPIGEEAGERRVGLMQMRYRAVAITAENDPETLQ